MTKEKTPSKSPNGGWIISFDVDTHKPTAFYPPVFYGDYPNENCVEVTQDVRDALWEEMQQHPMCYDSDAGVFVPYVPPAPTLEQLKARKRAEIAAARYIAETAGIIINGVSIATDRDSQALLTGAAVSAMLDDTYTVEWKQPDGSFVSLNAAQIIELGKAVRAHVEACFNSEKELYEMIDAALSAEEVEQIKWGAE